MIAKKLRQGSLIRVCAPSRSLSLIAKENRAIADDAMKKMGLRVSFSKNAEEADMFRSSGIESRASDLHEAFADKKVDGILTAIGGFNSNQLLPYLDYGLIKKNPKVFCGYSDITALSNAIYAKTGLVTYSGLHYSSFAKKKDNEYAVDYFKKCLFDEKPFGVLASGKWSDDPWWVDQEKCELIKNPGYRVVQKGAGNGKSKGTIVGGNLCTFILLHGTPFMPKLKNSILFIEDDDGFGKLFDVMFDRHLTAILQQPGADGIRAVVIGRPQKSIDFPFEKIEKIIKSKKELNNVPVIFGADFGHTTPIFTFPVGGTAEVSVEGGKAKLRIIRH